MAVTLEDVEKTMQAQAAEIKALKESLASTAAASLPPEKIAQIEKQLQEVLKNQAELHEKYSQATKTLDEQEHHCHWCG